MSSTGIPLGDAATFWSGIRTVKRLRIGAAAIAVVAAAVCLAASLRTSPTTTSLSRCGWCMTGVPTAVS